MFLFFFLLQHDRRRHHSSLSHFDAACVSALPFVFFSLFFMFLTLLQIQIVNF
jgi:hypothetical protein